MTIKTCHSSKASEKNIMTGNEKKCVLCIHVPTLLKEASLFSFFISIVLFSVTQHNRAQILSAKT
jgi:hypothetical protein